MLRSAVLEITAVGQDRSSEDLGLLMRADVLVTRNHVNYMKPGYTTFDKFNCRWKL